MQVVQTAGVPPSSGSSILPTSGCTTNSSKALTKIVNVKRTGSRARERRIGTARGLFEGATGREGYQKAARKPLPEGWGRKGRTLPHYQAGQSSRACYPVSVPSTGGTRKASPGTCRLDGRWGGENQAVPLT